MSTYVVTYVDGNEERIEASSDNVGQGVLILIGEPSVIIPLHQIKKVKVYESAT